MSPADDKKKAAAGVPDPTKGKEPTEDILTEVTEQTKVEKEKVKKTEG